MYYNNKEIFLISVPILKAKSYINRNVEDSMIFPAIKTAQDIYLKEVIGEKLLTKLCILVETNSVTTKYEKLLKTFIQDYLCYRTMSELQLPLWQKIREQGIVNTNGTNYQQVSKSEVDFSRQYYDNLADQMAIDLTKYLDEHYKDYPEWESTCCREVNKITTNIYLG